MLCHYINPSIYGIQYRFNNGKVTVCTAKTGTNQLFHPAVINSRKDNRYNPTCGELIPANLFDNKTCSLINNSLNGLAGC